MRSFVVHCKLNFLICAFVRIIMTLLANGKLFWQLENGRYAKVPVGYGGTRNGVEMRYDPVWTQYLVF